MSASRVSLAKSPANSGAHPPEKEPCFPLAFLGVRCGWIVAVLCVLFSLPAIIAVAWMSRNCGPLQMYELAGIRLKRQHRSQGFVVPSDFQRNWTADRYGIWGSWTLKVTSIGPEAPCENSRLDSPSPPQCEANHVLLAGEMWISRRTPRGSSADGFNSATRGEDATFRPFEEARQEIHYLSRASR